jgi:hypothetical protein
MFRQLLVAMAVLAGKMGWHVRCGASDLVMGIVTRARRHGSSILRNLVSNVLDNSSRNIFPIKYCCYLETIKPRRFSATPRFIYLSA